VVVMVEVFWDCEKQVVGLRNKLLGLEIFQDTECFSGASKYFLNGHVFH
jgi:hypothetical protein